MKMSLSLIIFLLVELAVVVFVLATVDSMPAAVASHFSATGMPNGYMPRHIYAGLMLFITAGMPALVVASIYFLLGTGFNRFNIPNREYWLSPANRPATVSFMRKRIAWLGVLISLFGAYVHWLTVVANHSNPVKLPETSSYIGIGVFILAILVWGVSLSLRFMRIPTD